MGVWNLSVEPVRSEARGRPYTVYGFRTMFFRLIRRLEADGKVSAGLTFHGLRHTLGARLAEVDVDTQTIAAILGHATTRMAAHYSEEGDRVPRANAAIHKLERGENGKMENSGGRVGKPGQRH